MLSYDTRSQPSSAPQFRKPRRARLSLFSRFRAPERKPTPLFSVACTLFCKNTGGRGVPGESDAAAASTNSHGISTYANAPRNAHGINTCTKQGERV